MSDLDKQSKQRNNVKGSSAFSEPIIDIIWTSEMPVEANEA